MLSPAQYAVLHGADLYDWQMDALEAFGRGYPVALLTCNGAGKTAVVAAWAMAWVFYRHPQGKVVATSGSFNQLQNQLWPAVCQHLPHGSDWTSGGAPCKIKTPSGGVGIGFSTNDAGKAEGWHPTVSPDVDPVAIFVDEAKTVPDEIFTAFDRCTAKYRLFISSAGAPKGKFYDMFGRMSPYYWSVRVPSTMCPHIDKAKIERDRYDYGEDSWEFKSMHKAEFADPDSDRLVLPAHILTRAIEAQPAEDKSGETVAFCDFAAGRDENVLAIRQGNVARVVAAWRERDTVQAAREFVGLFKEHGLTASQIWGDADGLGIGFVHQFADLGWRINPFRGGEPAQRNDEYNSLISQIWHEGAAAIRNGRVNIAGLDKVAFEQLTTRKSRWNDRGKLALESKDELSKSPDRADALLGCIGCGAAMTNSMTGHSKVTTAPSTFATRASGFNLI